MDKWRLSDCLCRTFHLSRPVFHGQPFPRLYARRRFRSGRDVHLRTQTLPRQSIYPQAILCIMAFVVRTQSCSSTETKQTSSRCKIVDRSKAIASYLQSRRKVAFNYTVWKGQRSVGLFSIIIVVLFRSNYTPRLCFCHGLTDGRTDGR